MQALIYTKDTSPRVDYIFSTLLQALGFNDLAFTTDSNYFKQRPELKINYSASVITDEEIRIAPALLLFETGITNQNINFFDWNGIRAFYKTGGDLPFDIFAASFYLLTRYEEYLPYKPDTYGRYDHGNSLAFQHDFLNLPVINIWLQEFKKLMLQKFPFLKIDPPLFCFTPTYDIDIAWSYKHKGFSRNAGGFLKSIVKRQLTSAVERIAVLSGTKADPFDSYEWLNKLHAENQLTPIYFFLLSQKNKGYDKNILPDKEALKLLIKDHNNRYKTGIHPSWQSGDDRELLLKEIKLLENITNTTVQKSRQHYIRMTLPETYRRLVDAGIKEDYSMGYGSINGFRASYCLPYKWYDLEKEQQTDLIIFPFCYMDANSYFEQHYSAEEALKEMEHYYNITKQVDGHFITIWHNHFLGTDKMFEGWSEVYRKMIDKIYKD